MGRLLTVAVLLGATGTASAQEQTLLSGGIESGGWGGPVVAFTSINGQFAVMAGGRGAWLINSTFGLGGAGYGLTNEIQIDPNGPPRQIEMGYGGLDLEVIVQSDNVIHFTVNALIGGGAITPTGGGLADGIFVFQPQANVDVNLTGFMRIGLGGGYRFVADVDFSGLTNGMFRSGFGALTFKFGSF